MIQKFLSAKHWQLFLLTIGLPIVFQIFVMVSIFAQLGSVQSGDADPSAAFGAFKLMPLVMLVYVGMLFGWFWAIVVGLQAKIPDEAKMNLGWFKVFLIFPLVYLMCFIGFISLSFSSVLENPEAVAASPEGISSIFIFVIPLHLLSMFGMMHSLYCVAKAIKTAELQRVVSFSEFVGEFFLVWFYPIGIWILQPKINKMVEDDEDDFYNWRR